MVLLFVLFFLVLPFCVEDSSATPLSPTRTRRYVSPTVNSLEINDTEVSEYTTQISFTVFSSSASYEDENKTLAYSEENNETVSKTVTDNAYTTSPKNLGTQANLKFPKSSELSEDLPTTTEDIDVSGITLFPDVLSSTDNPQSPEVLDENTTNTEDTGATESTDFSYIEISGATDDSTDETESTPYPTAVSDSTTTESTTLPATESPTILPTIVSSTISPTSEPSTTLPTTEPSTPSPIEGGIPIGLIIGIIVAILLVGVGIVLWRAHHSGRLLWPPKHLFSNGLTDPIRPQPVALKKFPAHCSDMLNVPSKLSHEYQLLATLSVDIYGTESFVSGQLPDNKCKNRYVNILPYDSTRVKLAPEGDDFFSDYVNASYIKGYTNEIEYIATQGPKEETCRDFWKMVYQEPIKVIIMVTQLEEQGKPKCYKYYPNLRENMEFEDIVVRCTTELHFPIYTSRTLILTKGERKRSIIHLHFREWPDFGCPATPDLMLQFCQVMRHNIVLAQPGVTLIHCSAGVGRTGTLIAVDILLQHIKENKKIDIFGTVYKLRKHRMNMVQSEAQYVYIYKCIKEALEDPSYLSSENSSTTSLEPIYENIECTRLSTVSNKVVQDSVVSENECAL